VCICKCHETNGLQKSGGFSCPFRRGGVLARLRGNGGLGAGILATDAQTGLPGKAAGCRRRFGVSSALTCLHVTPLEGRAPGRGGVTKWHSAERTLPPSREQSHLRIGVEMPLHNKWEVLNPNCPEFYPIIWVSFNEHILTAILKGEAVCLETSTEALPQTGILGTRCPRQ
jgi:hypothetical protein